MIMGDVLAWTKERPTKPGIYWAYEAIDPLTADVMLIEIVERYYSPYEEAPDKKELLCYQFGDEHYSHIDDFSNWIGPIVKPNPPT